MRERTETLGGTFKLSTQPGRGTSVEVLPPVSAKPRVLIADDHPPTRMGVRMALERDGLEVCAEAFDATGAVEAAKRERPDACLLDVHMPGGGPAAASSITAQLPDTVILMLSVSREEEDLLESLRRAPSATCSRT